ncbi:MAG: hypothetical protein ACTSR8_14085 [Promethearchaeota archaeon]
MITYGNAPSKDPLICSICRNPIKEQEKVYQSNLYYGLICSSCEKKFANEDLDFIVSLFTAFGGYFAKHPSKSFSIDSLCNGIEKGGQDKLLEMQVKIFHNGLLYGIPPKEVEQIVKTFLEKR